MLSIRRIGLAEFYSLAQDLVQDHFNEVASSKEDFEFQLNWRLLEDLEKAGFLHICAMFGDSLVGYALIMKVPNLIHAQVRTCVVQSVYLVPQYRLGRNGLKLVKYAENLAAALDAQELKVSISKNSRSTQGEPLSKLFTALGYKFREVVYSKRL